MARHQQLWSVQKPFTEFNGVFPKMFFSELSKFNDRKREI